MKIFIASHKIRQSLQYCVEKCKYDGRKPGQILWKILQQRTCRPTKIQWRSVGLLVSLPSYWRKMMPKTRYDERQLKDLLLQMMETELGGEKGLSDRFAMCYQRGPERGMGKVSGRDVKPPKRRPHNM